MDRISGDQITGLGILIVLFAIVAWMLFYAIKDAFRKAARLPGRQMEWHESMLAAGDECTETAPTAVVASVPRWEREVRAILAQVEEIEDADVDEIDW